MAAKAMPCLVARRLAPLEQLASELRASGITAESFSADLRRPEEVAGVLAEIQFRPGQVDTLYYGPNAPEVFVPAFTLKVEDVKDKVELFLYGLVAAVEAVLQQMRERKAGTIFFLPRGSAGIGLPLMSGPGPRALRRTGITSTPCMASWLPKAFRWA